MPPPVDPLEVTPGILRRRQAAFPREKPLYPEGKPADRMSRQLEITPEGLKKLEEELEYLTTVRRREVSERIKEARAFGDISENAEYDDAKNEQAQLEAQIAQLEERLRRSVVVEEPGENTGEVIFGSVVHIKDQKSGESRKFQIVGSTEADLSEGKLSSESPIGSALIGGKVNQIVTVPSSKGPARKFKITKIDAA
jgi:transcription elongation factor GreA